MIGQSWCRRTDGWSDPTEESRARGFGPFGRRTEEIRRKGSDLMAARTTGNLDQQQLAPWYAAIADSLV